MGRKTIVALTAIFGTFLGGSLLCTHQGNSATIEMLEASKRRPITSRLDNDPTGLTDQLTTEDLEKRASNLGPYSEAVLEARLQIEAYKNLRSKYPVLFATADQKLEEIGANIFDKVLFYSIMTHEPGLTELYFKGIFEKDGKLLRLESNSGALGIFGIMPETLALYNKYNPENTCTIEDMQDYGPNTDVFLWNFSNSLKKRNNVLWATLMDHNWGPSNVDKMIEKYGLDINDPSSFRRVYLALDKAVNKRGKNSHRYVEPRDFVPKIIGTARIYFGVLAEDGQLDLPIRNPEEIKGWIPGVALYLIDGESFPSFVAVNANESPYLIKPHDYDGDRIEEMMSVTSINGTPVIPHFVEKGQTVSDILKGYGYEIRDLERLCQLNWKVNEKFDPNKVYPGDVVYVPGPKR